MTYIDLHHLFFHRMGEKILQTETKDCMLMQHASSLTHRKILDFWERFANDLQRLPSDFHQKMQKSPKYRGMEVIGTHIQSLRTREKSKFSLT